MNVSKVFNLTIPPFDHSKTSDWVSGILALGVFFINWPSLAFQVGHGKVRKREAGSEFGSIFTPTQLHEMGATRGPACVTHPSDPTDRFGHLSSPLVYISLLTITRARHPLVSLVYKLFYVQVCPSTSTESAKRSALCVLLRGRPVCVRAEIRG